MTQIDANRPDLQTPGQSGGSLLERMRLAKSWDETLRETRVIKTVPREGISNAAGERVSGNGLMRAAGREAALQVPEHGVSKTLPQPARPARPPAILDPSPANRHMDLNRGAATGPYVQRELDGIQNTLKREGLTAPKIVEQGVTPTAAEPAIRFVRTEGGVMVLVVHPGMTTAPEIARFVSEIRQSMQSLPLRVRSIRLNGHEVYADARPGGIETPDSKFSRSNLVDVKY